MGIDPNHLVNHVVIPTLNHLGERFATPSAINLVIGTALVESKLRWLVQLNDGPARGLWQMEPKTHADHVNWLSEHQDIRRAVNDLSFTGMTLTQQITGNLYYACAMCRVHYWRVNERLPLPDDVSGMASYWKRFYNTRKGKGTLLHYVSAWEIASPVMNRPVVTAENIRAVDPSSRQDRNI